MLGTTFTLAIRSILRHKLRSFLTTLGIIIGVAAVVAMVTLGKATTAAVQQQIASLGTNILQVRPGQGFVHGGMHRETRRVDGVGRAIQHTPLHVDLDQIAGRDLAVMQAKGVEQKVTRLTRDSQRDVVVDQLGPAQVVKDAVGRRQLHPGGTGPATPDRQDSGKGAAQAAGPEGAVGRRVSSVTVASAGSASTVTMTPATVEACR